MASAPPYITWCSAYWSAGIASLAISHGRLLAAGSDKPRFLMVFLRGGYDAASLLVPVSSNFYYEVRPDIAIARPSSELTSALPLMQRQITSGLKPMIE